MSVDLTKIRPDDEVAVRAYISVVESDGVRIRFHPEAPGSMVHLSPSAIVSHTPKALAVGDRVRLRNGFIQTIRGVIRALDAGEAWVRWDSSSVADIWQASDLERVDD